MEGLIFGILRYMRVRWNLNFIRECMENVQESPKIHLLKKQKRNKNDSTCVFVVCFTVCSLLEPLRSRLMYNSKSNIYIYIYMRVRWNLNFTRECMENVQESPKIHLLKKQKRNKNDSTCVFVMCFTVCSLLEPLRSRLMYNLKSKTRRRLNRDVTHGFYTRPAQWLYNAKWRKQHRLTKENW